MRRLITRKNCGAQRALQEEVSREELQSAGFGWWHIVFDFSGSTNHLPILSQFESLSF
jgi:hypothetical protein